PIPHLRHVANDVVNECLRSSRRYPAGGANRVLTLLLTHRLPFALAGDYRGMSMLFPMERLFERYVLSSLRMIAPDDFEIYPQHGALHLCSQNGEDWFQMRPDILVKNGDQRWIIDAKWKRLSTDRENNYELSQADFYQLFAYGQKYLGGAGEMFLVYPAVSDFPRMRAPFKLSDSLLLHVLPFDLARRRAPYTFLPTTQRSESSPD
ncbi:hypothetical protein CN107_29775, partial [Sinorhizobium meliloti]